MREDRLAEASAGMYFENTIAWLPSFRSVAGVRYDAYRFDVDSSGGAHSGRASDGIASPKLSLVSGPWSKTELFVNAGKGFHSNDARGVTQAASPVTPLVATRGMANRAASAAPWRTISEGWAAARFGTGRSR